MMRKIIRLWNDGRQWLAEYEGPEKEEIIGLMGSPFVPTAYLAAMPREQVIKELERLNPGYEII